MLLIRIAIFLCVFKCFVLPLALEAAIITWTGAAGDDNWTTAGNWDTGVVPQLATDVAKFTSDASPDLENATNISLAAVQITNSSNVSITNTAAGGASITLGTQGARLPRGVPASISGGRFQVDSNVSLVVDENSRVSVQSQDGNYIGLGAIGVSGDDAVPTFSLSRAVVRGKPSSGTTYIEAAGSLSDFTASVTINKGAQFALSNSSSIHSPITIKNRGILLGVTGSETGTDEAVSVQRGGTINAEGAMIFAGGLSNSGQINLISTTDGNSFTTLTNTRRGRIDVNTSGDATVAFGAGNGITNSGVIRLYGSSSGANTFADSMVNGGSIYCYGSSKNTFGTFTNNKTMLFYGIFGVGTTNTFGGAFTNNGTMRFYGVEDSSGNGGSTNTFTADFTNSRTMQFYEGSANTFSTAGTVTNTGRNARLQFFGNTVNSFSDKALSNTSRGITSFFGSSTNTFAGTSNITNGESSTINFYGNSNTTLNTGGIFTNNGTTNIYGQSSVNFGFQLAGTGTVNLFGSANVDLDSGGNATTGNINIYESGVLVLGSSAALTGPNQTILVGKNHRRLRGGTLTNDTGAANTTSVQNVVLARNGGGTLRLAEDSVLTAVNFTQNNGTFATTLGAGLEVGKLVVTGTATLGGPLVVTVLAGFTPGNFTIIDASAGTLTGTFSSVTTQGAVSTSIVGYPANSAVVTLAAPSQALVLPVEVKDLNPNDRSLARFLFGSAPKVKRVEDAKKAINTLAREPAQQFKRDLKRLKPIVGVMSLNRKVTHKKQLRGFVNRHFIASKTFHQNVLRDQKQKKEQRITLFDLIAIERPQSHFFTNSIQETEEVKGLQGKFSTKVRGADFGYQRVYRNQFILEHMLSCSSHELDSKNKLGSSSWTSASYAPSLGILSERGFVKVMALGGSSFFNQSREIAYANLNRKAQSHYHSFDLLGQVSSGYHREFQNDLLIEVDANLALQNIYTSGYRERGAQGLDLVVSSHCDTEFLSDLTIRSSKKFKVGHSAIKTQISLCYLAERKLMDQAVEAKFAILDEMRTFKSSQNEPCNQKLALGFDFSVSRSKHLELTAQVEANMLKVFKDISTKAKLNWMF